MIDLVVIGAGPAGLSAATVAHGNGLRVQLLEQADRPGGQLLRADHGIGDCLGQPARDGAELAARLHDHARAVGVDLRFGTRVDRVEAVALGFRVEPAALIARAVIVATGTTARRLGYAGEEVDPHLRGLAPALAGKRVVIVGGGDEACSTATVLADHGAHVTLVVRAGLRARPQFRDPVLADRRIDVRLGELVAGTGPDGLRLSSGAVIAADRVFTRAGVVVQSPLIAPEPARTDDGCFLVDARQRTTVRGIYAAGDGAVTAGLRYVVTAIAQGAVAARTVEEDLTSAASG